MSGKSQRTLKKTKKSGNDKSSSTKVAVEKMAYQTWFGKKVVEGRVGYWQEKEIKIFFLAKGLAQEEDPKKYEEMLKSY